MSAVNLLAFGEAVCKEGRLSKRQRGRKESTSRGLFSKSPASLKFQERYFLLTNRRLIYKDKKVRVCSAASAAGAAVRLAAPTSLHGVLHTLTARCSVRTIVSPERWGIPLPS